MSHDEIAETVDAMRAAARALTSPTASSADEIRALATALDAIDAALSDRLVDMDESRSFEPENASSVTVWAAREIRRDPAETRRRLRAGRAMRTLPQVGLACAQGRMSQAHAAWFDFSLRHVGHEETSLLEESFVAVAVAAEPTALRGVVRTAKAVRHPEQLDDAWRRGMEKRDITVSPLPDGWHVTGFLPIDVGAKLDAVLRSLSTPTEAGDRRSSAQRRVEGLDDLLTRILAEGLPTDGTVTPQIHVVVEAGTLKAALAPTGDSLFEPAEPATLIGFGHIGPGLLAHLTCGAALTPVLVDRIEPNTRILDVGRTHRRATAKQREGIWLRQAGRCATAHCHHPIDHIHHEIRWIDDGLTNIEVMTGRCRVCHVHIHARDGTVCLAA